VKITKKDIESLKQKVNLLDYYDKLCPGELKETQQSYRGLCPLCSSSDGFSITKGAESVFFCYSCNEKGDIFTLNQKLTGNSFVESFWDLSANKIDSKYIEMPKKAYRNKYYSSIWQKSKSLSKKGFLTVLEEYRDIPKHLASKITNFSSLLRYSVKGDKISLVVPIFSLLEKSFELKGVQEIFLTNEDIEKKVHGQYKDCCFSLTTNREKNAPIIFVESFYNASILAGMGYNAICVFSANARLDMFVEKLSKYYTNLIVWFDNNKHITDKKVLPLLRKYHNLKAILFEYKQRSYKEGYDINDLLSDNKENYCSVFSNFIKNATTYQDLDLTEVKYNLDKVVLIEEKELENAFKNPAKIKLIQAGTGLGKSHQTVKSAIVKMRKQEPVTIFCSTLEEVDRIYDLFVSNTRKDEARNICKVVSDASLEDEKIMKKQTLKLVVVSTYGYLGLRGETGYCYEIAKELVKRHIFCDEIQELAKKMLINFFLAYRALLVVDDDNATYKNRTKCPISSRRGNCSTCRILYNLAALDQNKKRSFIKAVDEKDIKTDFPRLPLDMSNIYNTEKYSKIINTLNFQKVDNFFFDMDITTESLYQSKDEEKDESLYAYVQTLLRFSPDLHIRTSIPYKLQGLRYTKKELETLDYEEEIKSNIIPPKQSCFLPTLFGTNLVPLLQLFENCLSLTMMSATIPNSFIDNIKLVCAMKNEELQFIKIDKVPFKFNVALCKTNESFSLACQKEMLEKLQDKEYKTFFVSANKKDVSRLHDSLDKKNNIVRYYDNYYRGNIDREVYAGKKNARDVVLLTHARSSISRGVDMPDRDICIIDAGQYIPQASIPSLGLVELTQADILEELNLIIRDEVLQTVGRLFRSDLERKNDVIVDPRQIVIILHNLPIELVDSFKLDSNLIEKYREFTDFVSPLKKYKASSVIETIDALKNNTPVLSSTQRDKERALKLIKTDLNKYKSLDRESKRLVKEQYLILKRKEQARNRREEDNILSSDIARKTEQCARNKETWNKTKKRLGLRAGRYSKRQIKKLQVIHKDAYFRAISNILKEK